MGKQSTPIRRRADLDPVGSKSAKGATDSGSIAPSVPRCQPDTDPRAVRGGATGDGTRASHFATRRSRALDSSRDSTLARGVGSASGSDAERAGVGGARRAARSLDRRERGGAEKTTPAGDASRVASLQTRANARVRAGASARGAASHDGRLHRRRRRREDAVDRRPGARALPPGRRRRDARRDAIFFLDNDAVDASRDATPSTKRATRPPPDPAPRRR